MNNRVSILVLSSSLILSGCGGGGDTTEPAPDVVSGNSPTTSTVTTTGTITGFGSVIVNGVHYSTSGSTISTDDNPSALEQELAVGMVVQLEGTVKSDGSGGTARTIKYGAQLEGPVTFIDLANKQITMLGQIVQTDDLTVFERTTLATIKVGDILEVSGVVKAAGQFYASRVEHETKQANSFKVFGTVANLDTTAQTFSVSDLKVKYSTARFEDFTMAELANGQAVKVKGQQYDTATNSIVATVVDLQKSTPATSEKVWMEGIVSGYQPDVSLVLNGQTFLLTADTKFEYGLKTLLANGISIKLKAKQVGGNWQIEKVSFINQAVMKLSGNVSAIDLTNNTFTIGTTTFVVTAQTVLKDDSSRAVRFFDLKSLVVNDYLEVAAYKNAEGANVALKVERENGGASDGSIELKGIPTAVTADGFTLFGREIVTDSNTRYENDDAVLTKTEFFALLSATTVVEVHAMPANGKLLASRIEIKAPRKPGDGSKAVGLVEFKGALTAKRELQIEVNGFTVNIKPATKLKIGTTKNMTPTDFINGLIIGETVKVEGIADANKVVTAIEIEAEREKD